MSVVGALLGASFEAVVQAVSICLTGAYLTWKGALPGSAVKVMDRISMELFIPMLVLSKVIPQVDVETLQSIWPLALVCVWDIGWGCFLGWLFTKAINAPKFLGVIQAGASFPNTISVVVTLIDALCYTTPVQELVGEDSKTMAQRGVTLVLTTSVWWTLSRWTIAYYLLAHPGREESRMARAKKVMLNPPVVACVVSFVLGLISPFQNWWKGGSTTARLVTTTVDTIGACMIPTVLIILGARVAAVYLPSPDTSQSPVPESSPQPLIEMEEVVEVEAVPEADDVASPPPPSPPEDNGDMPWKVRYGILFLRQGLGSVLGLLLVALLTSAVSDPLILLICYLQCAGPPMINLSLMAGLHGRFESGLSRTLAIAYLLSIVSWLVTISACLRLLQVLLPSHRPLSPLDNLVPVTTNPTGLD
eukprot:Sspe_Gene.34152::Locus_16613_Transcript_2_3_Confidence_0.333_Length_1708::g.34152::m.34152